MVQRKKSTQAKGPTVSLAARTKKKTNKLVSLDPYLWRYCEQKHTLSYVRVARKDTDSIISGRWAYIHLPPGSFSGRATTIREPPGPTASRARLSPPRGLSLLSFFFPRVYLRRYAAANPLAGFTFHFSPFSVWPPPPGRPRLPRLAVGARAMLSARLHRGFGGADYRLPERQKFQKGTIFFFFSFFFFSDAICSHLTRKLRLRVR